MATSTSRTKKPTPLSTHALAAFLTWKQFDILLILRDDPNNTTALLSSDIEEIQRYDMSHGGAFYEGTSWSSVYSTLRTLERRRLVDRHIGRNGLNQWVITNRGRKALEWMT